MIGKHIWAIGGGKGGIGKSLICANLGLSLSRMGKRVILMDADLGGSNLHVLLGLRSTKYALNDFLELKIPLSEVMQDVGINGLKLISGASAVLGLANPHYAQKLKIISEMLRLDADYILLDLGAGTSYNVLDFFAVADQGLVVICPEPSSIQGGYGFIKTALFRQLTRYYAQDTRVCKLLHELGRPKSVRNLQSMHDLLAELGKIDPQIQEEFRQRLSLFRPKLIINMLSQQQEQESVLAVKVVAEKYLGIKVDFVGCLYEDILVKKSAKKMSPLLVSNPDCSSAQEINNIAMRLIALEDT